MNAKIYQHSKRTCKNGHTFFKTSECPVCPKCEQQRKPDSGFMATLSAPARRALGYNGITTLKKLSGFSESEILKLHGIGKSSIPKLKAALAESGLIFRRELPQNNKS